MMDILPDSRTKVEKRSQRYRGINWVPTYCASCHVEAPYWTPIDGTFFSWICDRCFETHGNLLGMGVVPDEVFFEKLKNVQQEEFGRELSALELVEALKDENHVLSKLVTERK